MAMDHDDDEDEGDMFINNLCVQFILVMLTAGKLQLLQSANDKVLEFCRHD